MSTDLIVINQASATSYLTNNNRGHRDTYRDSSINNYDISTASRMDVHNAFQEEVSSAIVSALRNPPPLESTYAKASETADSTTTKQESLFHFSGQSPTTTGATMAATSDAGNVSETSTTESSSPPKKRPASAMKLEDDEDDEEEEEEESNKKLRLITNEEDGTAFGVPKKVNNEQWDSMFERLKQYKQEHGDCLVPKRYSVDPKLGTWVETQRVQHKKLPRIADESTGEEIVQPNKRLTAERLAKLESIGFAWSAKHVRKKKAESPANTPVEENPAVQPVNTALMRRQRLNEAQWEDMYQRLAQFKEENGHCLVPRRYPADPKLATWVETQRVLWNRDYRHKESSENLIATENNYISTDYNSSDNKLDIDDLIFKKRLTPERKQKLDQLGFVWSLRTKRIEDHWDEMYQQLVEYKNTHGDCLVPSRYEANLKLGKWVETQRYEYTKLQRVAGELNDEVKSEFAESVKSTDSEVAVKVRPTNPRLTEDRLRRLEAINFEWKVKHKMKRYYDKQWDQMFGRLLAFKEVNGHCMVPKRYPPDMKLGTWVHTQRIQYRKLIAGVKKVTYTEEEESVMKACGEEVTYRLTDERRKRLEEVGFVWSAREGEKGTEATGGVGRITRNSYDDQWDTMFEQLRAYKEKNGDCLVPKRYKENAKLGTWVDTQRVQFKKLQKKLASQGKNVETELEIEGTLSCNDDDEDSVENQDSVENVENQGSTAAANDTSITSGSPATLTISPKPLVGRLTNERIRRLHNLGFIWSLRDDWQKHYEELKEYKREHGHCNVPARYATNRRLGIWVSAQRQQYKIMKQMPESSKQRRSAPLTNERIDLLNQLGFTWTIRSRDSLGESWNQRLDELKEFKALHGHCLVPSRYTPNPELGIWVGTQRTQYRLFMKSKETGIPLSGTTAMNEDRIHELEELGFVWALRNTKEEAAASLMAVGAAVPMDVDPVDAAVGEAVNNYLTQI